MKYFVVLIVTLMTAHAESEPINPTVPQQTLIAPVTASSPEVDTSLKQEEMSSEVAETQTRAKRTPIFLAKTIIGGLIPLVGAKALVGGVALYGAKYIGGEYERGHRQYGDVYRYENYPFYHNHYRSFPLPYGYPSYYAANYGW